jgi:N-methylhydantoinase A/oxoprolinase/acetone carboxylase beta subunit
MPASLRIGIDIGGRLTDFVVHSPSEGSLETFKLLSTQHDPAETVLKAVK